MWKKLGRDYKSIFIFWIYFHFLNLQQLSNSSTSKIGHLDHCQPTQFKTRYPDLKNTQSAQTKFYNSNLQNNCLKNSGHSNNPLLMATPRSRSITAVLRHMLPASSSMGRSGGGVSTTSTTTGGIILQNIDSASCLFCHRKQLLLGKTCIIRLSIGGKKLQGNESFRPSWKSIEKGKTKDRKRSPTDKDTEFLHKLTQLQLNGNQHIHYWN